MYYICKYSSLSLRFCLTKIFNLIYLFIFQHKPINHELTNESAESANKSTEPTNESADDSNQEVLLQENFAASEINGSAEY